MSVRIHSADYLPLIRHRIERATTAHEGENHD